MGNSKQLIFPKYVKLCKYTQLTNFIELIKYVFIPVTCSHVSSHMSGSQWCCWASGLIKFVKFKKKTASLNHAIVFAKVSLLYFMKLSSNIKKIQTRMWF
jgi:D-alanyl-lipoteichoic acid acyltransferase DltB (MBOAT superfamily)